MKTNNIAEVEITYKQRLSSKLTITRSKDAETYFREIWSNQMEYREEMYVLLLNRANMILGYNCLSKGGTTGTVVDTKMILQLALKTNAHSIILAHNHPSGNTKPSQADKNLTDKLKRSCELMEIKLLDHLILAEGSYLSMADEMMM